MTEDKERGKFINLVLRYVYMYIIGGKEKINNFFQFFCHSLYFSTQSYVTFLRNKWITAYYYYYVDLRVHFTCLFSLFGYFNILFLEMWRLLGVRASQMLEDFDSEMCHQLYEDSRSTSNPSPSRSDHNVTNTVYSVQYLSI